MKQAIKVRNVNRSGHTSMNDVDTISRFCDQADRVIEGWQLLRDLTDTLENVLAHHEQRMTPSDVMSRYRLVERARVFLEPDEEKVPAGATHLDPYGYYWSIQDVETNAGEIWTEDHWQVLGFSDSWFNQMEEL